MKTELPLQTAGFLLFVAAGAALALLFLLNVKITENKGRSGILLFDTLYCVLFIVVTLAAQLISGGKLELYMIFGELCGAFLVFLIFIDIFYKKGRF